MNCDCLPEVAIYEFKDATGAHLPMASAISEALGGTYPATNASTMPNLNNGFFIAKNEFGEDALYFIGFNTAQPYLKSAGVTYNGGVTAWTEALYIKLFGPRKPSK